MAYEGTQIGADGRRYDTGSDELEAAVEPHSELIRVYGTPAAARVIWSDPTTGLPTWVDLDDVEDFYPHSS